jgi:hypothetical protein
MIRTPCGLILAEQAGIVTPLTPCCGALGFPGRNATAFCSHCDRQVREGYTLAAKIGHSHWYIDLRLMLTKITECTEPNACIELVTRHFVPNLDDTHMPAVMSPS